MTNHKRSLLLTCRQHRLHSALGASLSCAILAACIGWEELHELPEDTADFAGHPPFLELLDNVEQDALRSGAYLEGYEIGDECNETAAGFPEEPCYTGPPETLDVGVCHAGILRCIDERIVCDLEQVPMPFDCTNGLDNTCDGFIDYEDETDIEIVLFVDWSGSMFRTLPKVRKGLLELTDILRDSRHVRIATVVFPDADHDGRCAVMQELVPPDAARSTIKQLEVLRVGGIEPSYQCLYDAAVGEYGFEFRPGADIIFVLFTDEPSSASDLTQNDVAHAMNKLGASAHFFVDPLYQRFYQRVVDLTHGTMHDLEDGEDLSQRLLVHVLQQLCRSTSPVL